MAASAPTPPPASLWKNLPGEIVNYITALEGKVESAWTHGDVAVIALVSAIGGWVLHSIF